MPRASQEPDFGLAHRQVLGRTPATVKWTPGKGLPWWYGAWRESRRFTEQQERELIALGRDPVTAEALTVRREAPHAEVWVPMRTWRPIYEFEAPILARRADGKVTIIAPDGTRRHIRAEGWTAAPSMRPKSGGSW